MVASLDFISSFTSSLRLGFLALNGNLFEGAIPLFNEFQLVSNQAHKIVVGRKSDQW